MQELQKVESNYISYYAWDPVVRTTHWLNLVFVAVMIYTGFMIGGAVQRPTTDEPALAFNMATMRNLHFLGAWLFTINGLFRGLWLFTTKGGYRQLFNFHPWQADFWREAWWKLKEYVTLRYTDYEMHTLGHNALAAIAYVGVFFTATMLGLSGLAMYGKQNVGGVFYHLTGWMIPLFGGEANLRMLHRLAMWGLIAFTIHHISFVIYLEVLREKGLLSSMVSGLKQRPREWQPVDRPWLKQSKPEHGD